jgi:hypothetical protein
MRSHHPVILMGWLLLVPTLVGCEETVTAPSGVDAPFSVYGVLNPRLETQSLLVSPIEPLLYDYPDEIDAVVTSTDLYTGEAIVWSDSVVRGDRGQLDHIFVAEFRPRFGGDYRIDVARSNGASSAVGVRIPEQVKIVLDDRLERYMDIHISGDSVRVAGAEVIYSVRWNPQHSEATTCAFEKGSYSIAYGEDVLGTDGHFRIRIDLVADHERVLALHTDDHGLDLGYERADGLALVGLQVRVLVTGPEWMPSSDHFTGAEHSFPGSASNVSNGYGFVGSGYDELRSLYPAQAVIDGSAFHDYLMRPPSDCEEYCTCHSR